MACYHPLKAYRTPTGVVFSALARYDIIAEIELPCGQCLGCRLRRSADWMLRITHEAQMHEQNCFVTLTYDDKLLPRGYTAESLEYAHYQRFMRRVRLVKPGVRFFVCGEYGEDNLRPHFHACLFDVDFPDRVLRGKSQSGEEFDDSAIVRGLWSYGNVSVQELNRTTASYCARYCVDKMTGDPDTMSPEMRARWLARYQYVDAEGEVRERVPEFSRCSLKPGIGSRWFDKYHRDIYRHDRAVLSGGGVLAPPKYYDRLMRRADRYIDEEGAIDLARVKRAQRCVADSTP